MSSDTNEGTSETSEGASDNAPSDDAPSEDAPSEGASEDAGAASTEETRPAIPVHVIRRQLASDAIGVPLLAAIGALVAVVDDASPTGLDSADRLWRALSGALIVVCAAFAPPFAWVLAAGGAAVSSAEPSLIAVGVVTLAGATLASFKARDESWAGGLIGVGVCWVVFRLPHDQFIGISTLVAAVVVLPLVFGAWYVGPPLLARALSWGAAGLAIASLLAAMALGYAGWQARNSVDSAVDLADEAVETFRDGNEDEARALLEKAVVELEDLDATTSSGWLGATRLIPVIAQHTEAVRTVVSSGATTADAALDVLNALDRGALSISNGAVDLDAIRAIEPSVDRLAAATAATRADFAAVRSPWLVPPVTDALDTADEEVVDAADSARRAADAVSLAPSMLGGEGTRNHLVLFATPSELRGTVGLIGNWALIEATDGVLSLVDVGRAVDINAELETLDIELTEPIRYVERYEGNEVETNFYDLTLSPHFPDAASVAAQLFEAATDTPVDTVLLVDPDSMAALLTLTGPVQVGFITVDVGNVRQLLLVDQYVTFNSENQRLAFLETLLTETFLALLTIEFPDPWDLDEVFEQVVDEDRMVFTSIDADEQALLVDLGLEGGFPMVDEGVDLLGVVTQNAGQNKIDTFLRRSIDYNATINPLTGGLTATATITLTNTATNLELPDAIVASNDQGLARGTNLMGLSVFTPHNVVEVRIDGVEEGLQGRREYGVRSFTGLIEVGSGETVVVELDLAGSVSLVDGYELVVPVQPTVSPDRFRFRVASSVPGTRLNGSRTAWQATAATSADQRYLIPVEVPS